MEDKTFVGLDIHRKTVVATALAADGNRISQVTLGPTHEELVRHIEKLPGEKHVALEACCFWERYYETVRSTGAQVTLSHPHRTRLIAEASLKTDKVDSESLATLLRLDSLPTAFAPPRELRDLRQLVKDRSFFKREISALLNHTYYLLSRRGVLLSFPPLNHYNPA